MNDLKTYTHTPKSGNDPKQLVILLHGLGANGQDLTGLARYWQDVLPDAVFVSPDAPFPCDMAPGMPNSYQWFSLQSRAPEDIQQGIETARPILNQYIDKMLQHFDIKDQNCALAGFSQGTMMSLYTGPRRNKPLAGILGFSGALFGAEELSAPDIQKCPIHLIHGEADPVVPVAAWHEAKTGLESAGFTITGHTTPGLPHGIDDSGIASGAQFLHSVFSV